MSKQKPKPKMSDEEVADAFEAAGGTPKRKPHPGGRPTSYDPAYAEQLLEYFNIDPWVEVPVTFYNKDGGVSKETIERKPNPPPHLSAFARKIGVSRDTLYQWAKVHPEFSDAVTRAKEQRREIIIDNGLVGLYNPHFAKLAAWQYFGWSDKTEIEHSGEIKSRVVQVELPKKGGS